VVSFVLNRTAELLASFLTTNTTWLAAPDVVESLARYTPETAVAGTAHEAEVFQLPQSTRPVVTSVAHAGWFCELGMDGAIEATFRAPSPP